MKRTCYLWAGGESYMATIAGEGVTERVGTPCWVCWDMSQVYSPVSQLLWLVFFPSLPKPVLYLSSQGWNDSLGLQHAHLSSSHGDVVKKQVWLHSKYYYRNLFHVSDSTLNKEGQEFPFVHVEQHLIFSNAGWGPKSFAKHCLTIMWELAKWKLQVLACWKL